MAVGRAVRGRHGGGTPDAWNNYHVAHAAATSMAPQRLRKALTCPARG